MTSQKAILQNYIDISYISASNLNAHIRGLMESGSVEFLGSRSNKPVQTNSSTNLDITATTILCTFIET